MKISQKQVGVFKGMATAMLVSLLTVTLGIMTDPFHFHKLEGLEGKLEVLGLSIILPTLFLTASIGRLAKFRFFSPEDIDGSGLTKGSEKAIILQSLLQNTLEQLVIAVGAYTAWCLVMPAAWLSAVPLCSLAFAIGRLSFYTGYQKGAPSRAFGFALTFYPTALLLLLLVFYQIEKFIT
ncbi:MAPEG family protein [Desulfogranum marinum]|uniref:MAPEG family protein n=1 Tax=Desulfogranum marinum TaxID=453220 RepID=UPI0019645F0C|nr:MAPEG family protein [Desulfogranum marinum]MBM9514622.1 MAPEG family protein [Desulfogranum marinum]